jgi:hypothetical protein
MIARRSTLRPVLGLVVALVACGAARAQTSPNVIPPPQARLIDSLRASASNDMKARLDNFAVELQNDPGASALVIAYVDRKCGTTYLRARSNLIRSYLVNTRRVDASRVSVSEGGRREAVAFELWLVPQGAARPALRPTLPPCPAPRAGRGRQR